MNNLPLVSRFALNFLIKSLLIPLILGAVLVLFEDYTLKGAGSYLWDYKWVIATFALTSSLVGYSHQLPLPEVPYRTILSPVIFTAALPLIGEGIISPW